MCRRAVLISLHRFGEVLVDDLLMIVGALLAAIGAALVYVPAGVVLAGVFLLVAGVVKARTPKATT